MLLALLLTLLAVSGIVAGLFLGRSRTLSPQLLAIGGGLLCGISLFWVFPEMIESSGWILAALLLSGGVAALWLVDRFIFAICPSCSHNHDHEHDCHKPPLHGFALPLLVFTSVHSLLDGWSIRLLGDGSLISWVVVVGLALHKIPEGLALGIITRKSMASLMRAAAAAIGVECFTLLGAWIEPQINQAGAVRFGAIWTTSVLGLIAGSFLFLGYHTVHTRRKSLRVLTVFGATVLFIAGAALFHRSI
jgi:zinc and cadmium transporter